MGFFGGMRTPQADSGFASFLVSVGLVASDLLVSAAGLSEPDLPLSDSGLLLSDPDLPVSASDLALAVGFAPLFLKSVAYQPFPFNWNPAALTCFSKVGLPHFGHSVSLGSLTFC